MENILFFTQLASLVVIVALAVSRSIYKSSNEELLIKVKSLEVYLADAKLYRDNYRTLWQDSVSSALSPQAKSTPKQKNYVSSPTQSVKANTYSRTTSLDDSSDDSFMNAVFIQAAMNNTRNDTYCAPSYTPSSYDSSSSSYDSSSSSSDSSSSGGCE